MKPCYQTRLVANHIVWQNYALSAERAPTSQAVQAAQLETANAREEAQQAQLELLAVKNKKKYSRSRGRKMAADPLKEYDDTLRNYSKMFTFAQMLWAGCSAPSVASAKLPTPYDPATRFASSPVEMLKERESRTSCALLWEIEQTIPTSIKPKDDEERGFYPKVSKIVHIWWLLTHVS
jgi:hypothetical protein